MDLYVIKPKKLRETIGRLKSQKAERATQVWIEEALDNLSAEERTCLILREQKMMSVAKIAEISGLGIKRTHFALFSAREKLRAQLFTED